MQAKGLLGRSTVGVVILAGVLLAGCGSTPMSRPVGLDDEGRTKFNTGRVTIYVTDVVGMPLAKAMVDIESADDDEQYFRTAAFSDMWGKVTFNGVPEQVRISVYHAETQSNYSREFDVPPSGTTELRMLLYTQ